MVAAGLLSRHVADEIRHLLTFARVVHLVGPRQAGKTTLLRSLLPHGRYLTLDNDQARLAVEQDPYGHLKGISARHPGQPLIIDEAQRCMSMVLAIKRIVDEDNIAGQFVLAGSANLLSSLDVADSLAGRAMSVNLLPFSVAETKERGASRFLDWAFAGKAQLADLPEPEELSRDEYIRLILRGGFPPVVRLPLADVRKWHLNYVDRIVERDVADIIRIRKFSSLRLLIEILALRTGRELNKAGMCSDLALNSATVTDYLEILARLSMVCRLDAWFHRDASRAIRNAKYHFVDTGMAAAIRQLDPASFDADADPQALGGLLESFVYGELRKSIPQQEGSFGFHHWRDRRGREIDLLLAAGEKLALVEVKASTRVVQEDLRHLRWFAQQKFAKGRVAASVVFYLGSMRMRFEDGICALPVSVLWS